MSRPAGNGSTYGGGGSCIAARATSLTGDVGGIVLDVYGARLAVAGDISIGGCSGGQGFGVRGGSAGVTAITCTSPPNPRFRFRSFADES